MVEADSMYSKETRNWVTLWVFDESFNYAIPKETGPHQGKPKQFHHKLNDRYKHVRSR
jgi:hypothetical protein